MWSFVTKVLEQYGLLVVILLVLMAAIGWVGHRLWQDNRALNEKLRQESDAHKDALLELTNEHAKKLSAAQSALGAQITDLQKQLSAIQEKRVDETRAVTERVVTHVASVDSAMQSLDRTLEVLINLADRGANNTRG